jgi:DNA processing protein
MAVSLDLTILYALTHEARIGPKTMAGLLLHFHQPSIIWETTASELSAHVSLSEDTIERLETAHDDFDRITEDLQKTLDSGICLVTILDDQYPERLRRLDDPPTILYVRGSLPDPSTCTVAVVGTHRADEEGIADAVAWGKGLAERGVVVVSGLARGIDGGGHTGALAGGGDTIAVLGSGVDNVYPPEHRVLANEIMKHGALVSEYSPSAALTKARLVLRNRIIVGLSDAVVVVRVHEDTRGSMEAIRRARDIALPIFLVATDAGDAARQAVAEGALPIGRLPDFDLVLNCL